MSQNAAFEPSSSGRSTPTRPTIGRLELDEPAHAPLVLVGLVVGEQFVGGDAVVVVTGDLAVERFRTRTISMKSAASGESMDVGMVKGRRSTPTGAVIMISPFQVSAMGGDPGPPGGAAPDRISGADAVQGVGTKCVVMPVVARPGVHDRRA